MNSSENLRALTSLLHISDTTLPIGAYTHSNGLETYVQNGKVHDASTAQQYVQNMLKHNLKYNDGAFVKLAYQIAQIEDVSALLDLGNECNALKSPKEIRLASQKLGIRFLKIFTRKKTSPFIQSYLDAIKSEGSICHYPIAFGIYACLLKVSLQDTLFGFYYNAMAGMITNAVKLVPLGQLDGQDILFNSYSLIQATVDETIELERDMIGLCSTSFDIQCMQHERLYSRLYMS